MVSSCCVVGGCCGSRWEVKFPRGTVVYSGTRGGATREIVMFGSKKPLMLANTTCGEGEAQVGGYRSRLTGGNYSTNMGGEGSTLSWKVGEGWW